ncbi:MAG TPA: S8 family serine peptidase [Pantanalinema sp.]
MPTAFVLGRWCVLLALCAGAIAQGGGCASVAPGIGAPDPGATLTPMTAFGLRAGVRAEDGQLIVGLKPGYDVEALPALGGGQPVVLGALDFSTPLRMLRLPSGVTVDEAIRAYQTHPAVALIAPNRSVDAVPRPRALAFDPFGGLTPNDPYFNSEWGFGDGVTNARALWRRGIDASRVTVAVIDTGIDYNHPDLQGRVAIGYNFKDGNKDVMDRDGHGTHVAGLIGAAGNNGIGVAGVAWDVRLLAIKVMDHAGGTDFGAAAGIKYAVDAGAKVLNLSFSSDSTKRNPIFDLAVKYANEHGATVIAAAGNQNGPVSSPANSPGVLAISATSKRGVEHLASFSNHGGEVFLAAPGDGIFSTFLAGGYKSLSGTSMAAPVVAGAAAVLYAAHPGWTPSQVQAALAQAVDPLGTRGRTEQFGYGRIDLSKLP